MNIKKCDLCKKEIKKGNKSVSVYYGFYNNKEFCEKCALPIINFLKKKKLFKEEAE